MEQVMFSQVARVPALAFVLGLIVQAFPVSSFAMPGSLGECIQAHQVLFEEVRVLMPMAPADYQRVPDQRLFPYSGYQNDYNFCLESLRRVEAGVETLRKIAFEGRTTRPPTLPPPEGLPGRRYTEPNSLGACVQAHNVLFEEVRVLMPMAPTDYRRVPDQRLFPYSGYENDYTFCLESLRRVQGGVETLRRIVFESHRMR